MPRQDVYFTEGFKEKIEELAEKKKMSISALIRELVEREIKKHG